MDTFIGIIEGTGKAPKRGNLPPPAISFMLKDDKIHPSGRD